MQTTLIIMATGKSSRYGGLNQITLAKKMLFKEKEMENYINSLSQL